MTSFDKALVALIGAALTVVGTQPWGKVLADPALQASIISIVTAAVVYIVPNAPAAPVAPPSDMTYVAIVGYFLLGLVIGFGGGYYAFHVTPDPEDDESSTPASYVTR